jgi:hypothetical protein
MMTLKESLISYSPRVDKYKDQTESLIMGTENYKFNSLNKFLLVRWYQMDTKWEERTWVESFWNNINLKSMNPINLPRVSHTNKSSLFSSLR